MELENNREEDERALFEVRTFFTPKGFCEVRTVTAEDYASGRLKYITYAILEKEKGKLNRRGFYSESFSLDDAIEMQSKYISKLFSVLDFSWKWN